MGTARGPRPRDRDAAVLAGRDRAGACPARPSRFRSAGSAPTRSEPDDRARPDAADPRAARPDRLGRRPVRPAAAAADGGRLGTGRAPPAPRRDDGGGDARAIRGQPRRGARRSASGRRSGPEPGLRQSDSGPVQRGNSPTRPYRLVLPAHGPFGRSSAGSSQERLSFLGEPTVQGKPVVRRGRKARDLCLAEAARLPAASRSRIRGGCYGSRTGWTLNEESGQVAGLPGPARPRGARLLGHRARGRPTLVLAHGVV